ncbi:MAG: porin family protein [Magnetospirillum sp.]|nr:porin family protein [Magnetospirillum sp.]
MRTKFVAAAMLAAMGLVAAQASAQEKTVVTSPSKKVYAGVQAGMVVPEDVNFSRTATSANSGKIEFEDGYSVGGFAGYKFNDYLRGEASVTYAKFDYDKVTVNGVGTIDVDGDVKSTIGMVNGIVSPLGKSTISPLLGAGIGMAHTKDKASANAGGIAVNVDRNTNDLALSGLVGVEAEVSNSVSLGVRYNYFWVDSSTAGFDDLTAHNFSATAAIKF